MKTTLQQTLKQAKNHTKTAAERVKQELYATDLAPAAVVHPSGPVGWEMQAVRILLLIFAATLPIWYDLSVPEVSGDIRWQLTTLVAGLCTLLLLLRWLRLSGQPTLTLNWPPHLWIALGLVLWAGVSLIDALNPLRGIILIKALAAQMLLLMCVFYAVQAPGGPTFGRRLMWAFVAPMLITATVGIWQFHGFNDASFRAALEANWGWWWLIPLLTPLDAMGNVIAGWLGWQNGKLGIVGLATSYFLQSAVPGSTFANKNLAGSWTAMMLPVAFYLLLTAKRWPAQAWASLLMSLGTVFLVYSRARASWLSLLAAMAIFIVLIIVVPAWRKAMLRHVTRKQAVWLLLPLLAVVRWGGDLSPVSGSYAVDRTPTEQMTALASSSWNEIGGRLAYNLNSLKIVRDYWFNGVGLGSFFVIYPPYYNALVVTPQNSYSVMARPQRTHTDVMQAFDEMGIPGGVLFVLLFFGGISMAFHLAGKRAGKIGTNLMVGGIVSSIGILAVFLDYQGMVALPSPWNLLLYAVLFGGAGTLLLRAALEARAVQRETTAADDTQLLGLSAGIAVFSISFNMLMDFPMQLPTAPASAAMLLGMIVGFSQLYKPRMIGPSGLVNFVLRRKATTPASFNKLKIGKLSVLLLMVLVALLWALALYDGWRFRQANVLLKGAMVRIYQGINDDLSLALLEEAYRVYPFDPRVHEHLGVVYANYQGALPISVDERIKRLEWVLEGDPWGANHLVNLAGQYLQRVQPLKGLPNLTPAQQTQMSHDLARLDEIYERLQQVADFSHFTWSTGGMVRLFQDRPEEAMALFRRALTIQPGYGPAMNGLGMATQLLAQQGVSPVVVQDGILKK